MLHLSHKIFSVFSLDKDIGGISTMIELSTIVMSSEVKQVNLFLLKDTATFNLISDKFKKKKNVTIFEISLLDKIFIKIGILSNKIKKNIFNSDIIFIHNAKLASCFNTIYKVKPIILFFHTDKNKQIKMLKNITRVFAVNNQTKELINNFFKNKKAFLLPNCIKIDNKKYLQKTKSKDIVIGAMGRFVTKKGFDLLIQVIQMYQENQKVKLLIAGDGPLMHSYKRLIKNNKNIQLLGWVKDKERFFSKIDIFCIPSKIEPFGIVILEAMARGIPVISTRCHGPLDIIKNNKNGILININNKNEMKSAIDLLKNNAEIRKNISKNGLDTIKYKYTIEAYKKNLFSLLTDVLK